MVCQKRVLVVDDDPTMCIMLTYILGGLDYTVVIAHDGLQAATLLATDHNFDLVFTDLYMPKMNGAELLEHVQHHYPCIPVIVSTTDTSEVIQSLLLRQTVDGILPRPFTVQQLHEILDRLLTRSMRQEIQYPLSLDEQDVLIRSVRRQKK